MGYTDLNITLPREQAEELQALADDLGIPVEEFLEQALNWALDSIEEQEL